MPYAQKLSQYVNFTDFAIIVKNYSVKMSQCVTTEFVYQGLTLVRAMFFTSAVEDNFHS